MLLGASIWLQLLEIAALILLFALMTAAMFGPIFYAEYRVGKDLRGSYAAATPERRRRMRRGACGGAALGVLAAAVGLAAVAGGATVLVVVLFAAAMAVILIGAARALGGFPRG